MTAETTLIALLETPGEEIWELNQSVLELSALTDAHLTLLALPTKTVTEMDDALLAPPTLTA